MFCSLFCFCLQAAVPAHAATSAAAAAAQAAQIPNRGALFKIEDGGHTLYLFGTIHVGAADFYPLEPRVTAALDHAGTLALEIDPNGDPAGVVKAMQEHGLYHGGGPAINDIAPEFRPRLERLMQQLGISPASVAPMKPWLLASVLEVSDFAALGYQSGLAVDTWLSQQAHARKIPVLELESVGSQMALFDRMTLAEQCRFLEDGIVAIEDKDQAEDAREIARAWRNADAAGLEALAKKAADDDSFSGRFVQKVLLDERNPGLANGIARLLARDSNSMAAIGVLHLVGTASVPELLRKRGLKVERIY
ncbi:MAG TPA: TraB/GumN family protein [Janthinobacterium sp.]|jgi:hypothetical protein|nr:TraB/GumN family protein [Janthinobacterium sp.]